MKYLIIIVILLLVFTKQVKPLEEIKRMNDSFAHQCKKLNTLQVSELDSRYYAALEKHSMDLKRQFELDEKFGHFKCLIELLKSEYQDKKDSIAAKIKIQKDSMVTDCLTRLMNMLKDKKTETNQQEIVPKDEIDKILPLTYCSPTKYDDKEVEDVKNTFDGIKVISFENLAIFSSIFI